MKNHENVPRYNVHFHALTADQLDELLSVVFRECGGGTAEAMSLEGWAN